MRVVTDDAGDVPADQIETLNIRIVPINITFGTEEYRSGIDMDHAAFYAKVAEVTDDNFPKTSQPTPYQYEQVLRELIEEGEDEILAITVSDKLSGTYASAVAAARAVEGEAKVYCYDSKAGSAVQGIMTIEAARMVRDGAGIEAIQARLDDMRDSYSVHFLIDTLEYAMRGGRVSALRSTMASVLNIKPIMKLEDGVVVEAGKVRTYNKALDTIVEATARDVGDRPVKMAVMHAGKPDAGEALLQKARPQFNVTEEFFVDMAVAVAINLGPGALGLVAIPEAGSS